MSNQPIVKKLVFRNCIKIRTCLLKKLSIFMKMGGSPWYVTKIVVVFQVCFEVPLDHRIMQLEV